MSAAIDVIVCVCFVSVILTLLNYITNFTQLQVPYISAAIDVIVCLCFVSNHISFHLGSRVGGVCRE